jgi:hypothetical protein
MDLSDNVIPLDKLVIIIHNMATPLASRSS